MIKATPKQIEHQAIRWDGKSETLTLIRETIGSDNVMYDNKELHINFLFNPENNSKHWLPLEEGHYVVVGDRRESGDYFTIADNDFEYYFEIKVIRDKRIELAIELCDIWQEKMGWNPAISITNSHLKMAKSVEDAKNRILRSGHHPYFSIIQEILNY